MSDQPGNAAAPGFYLAEGGRMRYWDGNRWTDRYADTETPPPQSGPPPSEKKRNWFARHLILSGLGLLVLIIIIAALGNGGKSSTPTASPGVSASSARSSSAAQSSAPAAVAKKAAADKAAADKAAADKAAADKAAADKAVADKAAADKAVADKAAADKAAADKAAADKVAKDQAARAAEDARKPVLDAAAQSACTVLGRNAADVATKQDRSNLARAFNQYARQSSESKIVKAGEYLTDAVGSLTGFMWNGAVSIAAQVCLDGGMK